MIRMMMTLVLLIATIELTKLKAKTIGLIACEV